MSLGLIRETLMARRRLTARRGLMARQRLTVRRRLMMVKAPDWNGRILEFRRFRPMHGRDVLAVERTLRQRGFRTSPPSMGFGRHARANVRAFQHHAGLTVDGQYGSDTHKKLVPLFDDYARWLYAHQSQGPSSSPIAPAGSDQATREKIGHLMYHLWGFYAERPWTYNAVRPFRLYRSAGPVTEAFDCSWLATEVYFAAGLPDPNGFGYRGGAGNTETLRARGTAVTNAQPGDLIFYGFFGDRGNPAHVTMYSGNGKCIGFGSSGGPWLTPMDYRPIRAIHRYV